MRQECYKIIHNNINDTTRKIHKKLFDATINKNKLARNLYLYFYKLVPRAKRNKTDDDLVLFIMHDIDKSRKVVNREIRQRENDSKQKIMQTEIKNNRLDEKWFYVCSKHYDCAEDHEDYQGRIYYDNRAPQEIIDYAYQRNMTSLQDITSGPVWLVTRPYCRHYFVAYKLDDLLHGKYRIPVRKVGDYDLQTPARATLQYWQDQLAIAEKLSPRTEKIQAWIDKCKIMIRKWK